ncbi:MAG: 23S rRNA (adenine(2503)-C(2))-methyltransferase RlmN [Thermoguttaceae bacterium]|nr:23S rRNA (adenine(2503)-C(2))-methyltransferase RlmN [Thermoguttaceae bacterium]
MDEPARPLLAFDKSELVDFFKSLGLPAYRAGQVRRWIFSRKTDRFSAMSDLSKDVRARLTEIFSTPKISDLRFRPRIVRDGREDFVEPDFFDSDDSLYEGRVVAKSLSDDGSEKLLIEWRDGRRVECVLLRDDRAHRTACVSTQVGCAMGCAFCASGLGGFVRNLTKSEILEQLLRLNALLPKEERLTHIVVMGTGEPTLNLDALLPALAEATDSDGLDIGNRKVTISTVGIPMGIERLARAKVPYKLAISLHAPNDRVRDSIMPQNKIHPIAEVLRAADLFFRSTGRRVTYEYVLLDGINASVSDALELARLLRDKTAIVNAIPYNPAPELPFKTPSNAVVERFVGALESAGIQVKVRFRKGDKINAACGQLRWSLRDA